MGRRDVGGIIQMGGTRLGTIRYEPMKTGREGAIKALDRHEIAALLVIGGNGSLRRPSAASGRGT